MDLVRLGLMRASTAEACATVIICSSVRTSAVSNRTTIASFDAEHRHPRPPVATLVGRPLGPVVPPKRFVALDLSARVEGVLRRL